MRGTPARVVGALVLGVAVASTAACIPGIGGADKTAACQNMKTELEGISTKAQGLISKPADLAQVYTDAATKIRAEGTKAGGDVQSAGDEVAKDLDSLGTTLRQAAAGNVQTPDTSSLINAGRKLQTACNS
jgi:hypothetical protein